MSRLDDYRQAMLAAFPEISHAKLLAALDASGPAFPHFIIDHGLGPLWYERTGREEFRESRLAAEALFVAQEQALLQIDAALDGADIEYVVIKGAANRLQAYENPAVRACHDLDLLVRPIDRIRAAAALAEAEFVARPEARSISRELVLARGGVDVDLHWALLREGRLRHDITDDMISRRQRSHGQWVLTAEDAFFLLVVHPAFAKHLAGWDMGLHRVADILAWLDTQAPDRQAVSEQLEKSGVCTAAWATLRWVAMLAPESSVPELDAMLSDLQPGRVRRAWLERWLRLNLSERTSGAHWVRLLGFSMFLHDSPRDAVRATAGRLRARRRSSADLAAFANLSG
jgi:hypothetical protein